MLAPIPDDLTFEDAASVAVAGLTAGGLARVWPLEGRAAVVWGAAGAVGRMLVAILADRGVDVIGIASGQRVDGVRAAGANHVIDRNAQNVRDAVREYTGGRGVAAVFDPIGAPTFETSLQLLAPRGCLINYGELSGSVPSIDLHQLFPGSVFVTKYIADRTVAFRFHWIFTGLDRARSSTRRLAANFQRTRDLAAAGGRLLISLQAVKGGTC